MIKSKFIENHFIPAAIEKGLLSDDSLSYALDKIAKTKTLESSDNLDQNISNLIFNLKSRGMKSEASSLEEKWAESKISEAQYNEAIAFGISELLTAAHPDGDLWVGESEYARFHTLESTQSEILSLISRKIAKNKTRNIIKGAALALDMLKTAQIKPDSVQSESTLDPDEMFDLTADPETKKKSDSLNEKIISFNEDISSKTAIADQVASSLNNPEIFSINNLINNPSISNFYCSSTGIDKGQFLSFLMKYNYWFGPGEISADVVSRKISSLGSYNAVLGSLSDGIKVSPPIVRTYLYGTELTDFSSLGAKESELIAIQNMVRAGHSEYINNPTSIWRSDLGSLQSGYAGNLIPIQKDPSEFTIGIDGGPQLIPEKLAACGEAIANETKFLFDKFISEAGKIKAAQDLAKQIAGTRNALEAIKNSKILPVRATSGLAIKSVRKLSADIDSALTSIIKEKENISPIFPEIGLRLEVSLTDLKKSINAALQEITKPENRLSLEDDTAIPEREISIILSNFEMAARNWMKYYREASNLTPEQKNNIANFLNQIKKWKDALTGSAGNPWSAIRDSISGLNKEIKTFNQLQNFAAGTYQTSLTSVPAEYQVSSEPRATRGGSEPTYFKKIGQGLAPVGFSTAPKIPISAPKNIVPVANKQLQGNDLVRSMQYALSEFASKILGMDKMKDQAAGDIAKIKAVGPSNAANPNQFDGVWGPNTAQAINVANKWLPENLKLDTHLPSGMIGKSKEEIDIVAKKNFNTLAQVFRGLNVSLQGADNEVPLDLIAGPVEDGITDGQIAVRMNNLSSLTNFYKFLSENQLVTPTTIEGDVGFTVSQWKNIFSSFFARLNEKINNIKGTSSKNRYTNYYRNLYKLSRLFADGLKKLSIAADGESDFIIDEESLKSMTSISNNSSEKGAVKEIGDRASAFSRIRGEGDFKSSLDGTVLEDENRIDDSVPFSNKINLKNKWFSGTNVASLSQDTLSLQNFNAAPASEQAERMFAGAALTDEEIQRLYMRKAGLRQVKGKQFFDEINGTYWIVNQNTNKLEPLVQYPGYLRSKLLLQNSASLTQYQSFLANLKSGLNEAYSAWASVDRPEQLVEKIQDYHQRWLSAINNQLNQINRIFSKFRI